MVAAARREIGATLRAFELARPIVLLGAFVAVDVLLGWPYALPLGLATVLAASVLVHDLIHNALALPRRANEVALGVYALFLIKSGHALRRLHMEHHARCLQDDDHEGNVVHVATWRLLLTGPWLALQARWFSWEGERKQRAAQALETALNVVIVFGLIAATAWTGDPAFVIYLGCVIAVTVTAPILGAKIPHLLPEHWPRLVRTLRPWATRLTPAASSLLFHELHHRRPRIPAALLPEHRTLLDETPPSACADRLERPDRTAPPGDGD